MRTRSYKKKMLEDIKEKRIPTLSTDILMTIFSFLSNPDDIKNCMLLSKEIRWEIFRTKKIMENFFVTLTTLLENWKKVPEFLQKYGRYILKFRFKIF